MRDKLEKAAPAHGRPTALLVVSSCTQCNESAIGAWNDANRQRSDIRFIVWTEDGADAIAKFKREFPQATVPIVLDAGTGIGPHLRGPWIARAMFIAPSGDLLDDQKVNEVYEDVLGRIMARGTRGGHSEQ